MPAVTITPSSSIQGAAKESNGIRVTTTIEQTSEQTRFNINEPVEYSSTFDLIGKPQHGVWNPNPQCHTLCSSGSHPLTLLVNDLHRLPPISQGPTSFKRSDLRTSSQQELYSQTSSDLWSQRLHPSAQYYNHTAQNGTTPLEVLRTNPTQAETSKMPNSNLFLARNLRLVQTYQCGGVWVSQWPLPMDVTTSRKAKHIEIGPSSAKFSINPLSVIVYPDIVKPEQLQYFVHHEIRFLAMDSLIIEEWSANQNYGIATYLPQFVNLDVIFVVLGPRSITPTTDERLTAPKTEEQLAEKDESEGIVRNFLNTCQQQVLGWKLPPVEMSVVQTRGIAVSRL